MNKKSDQEVPHDATAILSKADLQFWETHGYLVIPHAVPEPLIDAAVTSIYDIISADPNTSSSWYPPSRNPTPVLEYYNSQSLWNIRQHPTLYHIFSQLWDGRKDIWCSVDRVCFNPPRVDGVWMQEGSGLHWDVDVRKVPLPRWMQGLIMLSDTGVDMGGFCCVKGIHKEVGEWVKRQSENWDGFVVGNGEDLDVEVVEGKKGDLLVWNSLLLHGNGVNLGKRPRIAQYVTMFPAGSEEEAEKRRTFWRNGKPPRHRGLKWEKVDDQSAQCKCGIRLTSLGEKLLGLRSW